MSWYKNKKVAQEEKDPTNEEMGYLAVTDDFRVHFFDPAVNWASVGLDNIIAKGMYNTMGEGPSKKSYVYLASSLPDMNLPAQVRQQASRQLVESIADFFTNLKIYYVEPDAIASSLKIIKEARRGWPLIDDRGYDPYSKSKPGDQNGGESPTSYLSTPGSTGLGSDDTHTKGPKGVDIGRGRDTERSEMLDLMSDSDGADATKSNDGRNPDKTESGLGYGENGWEAGFDGNFPENSDKYDEHPAQLSRMHTNLHRSVFDELASKRKK